MQSAASHRRLVVGLLDAAEAPRVGICRWKIFIHFTIYIETVLLYMSRVHFNYFVENDNDMKKFRNRAGIEPTHTPVYPGQCSCQLSPVRPNLLNRQI